MESFLLRDGAGGELVLHRSCFACAKCSAILKATSFCRTTSASGDAASPVAFYCLACLR